MTYGPWRNALRQTFTRLKGVSALPDGGARGLERLAVDLEGVTRLPRQPRTSLE